MNEVIKVKAEQYPIEEVISEDERIVKGWVSVQVKDRQGEVVPIKGLRKTLNTWMKRGGFITDQHTNRVIGKALRWYESEHPKSGEQGIIIDYEVFKDYSVDDQVWDEIKTGKRKGLSFGGRALDNPEIKMDRYSGEPAKHLGGLEAYEVASVTEPANQYAENIAVNFLAKSGSEVPEGCVNKRVEQRGSQFCVVHCHGPDAGKPIKCFDTKEEADAMHAAIQANKSVEIHKFTKEDAESIGSELGIDWSKSSFDADQFMQGLNVELEHKDITQSDRVMTGKIALAHLNELPDYYTKLGVMEAKKMEEEKGMDLKCPKCGTEGSAQSFGLPQHNECPKCGTPGKGIFSKEEKSEEVQKPDDERPPKEWFDNCVGRAESFADDPQAFCGALWHRSGKFPGFKPAEGQRESFGKSGDNPIDMILSLACEAETLKAKNLNTQTNNNEMKGGIMETKKENNEALKEGEDRLLSIEKKFEAFSSNFDKKFDQLISLMSAKAENPFKKPEEEEEEEPEKEKQSPSGGKVTLPKVPAGETDEQAKPEGDKVRMAEKELESAIDKVLIKKGITKMQTPRMDHDVVKNQEGKTGDFAMDNIILKARKGEYNSANGNREVRKFVGTNNDAALRKIVEGG